MSFRRISILGLGLIGGSVALAIRRHLSDCQIIGYDISAKTLDAAQSAGAIHRSANDLKSACDGADCIILCVPVSAAEGILAQIAPHLKPGVCITDVGSTKQKIVEAAHRLLPAGVHFVGSHPMAGRELSGFAAARADLFDGALCLTTPVAGTNPNALNDVEALWRSLGSRITRLLPHEHDRMVAQISHLPHVLASTLVTAVTDQAMAIAGPGFRDVTRIAASDGTLWRDILLDNAGEVRASIAHFRNALDQIDAMVKSGNAQDLQTYLTEAAQRRQALGKSST